jgi:hypothetical protein
MIPNELSADASAMVDYLLTIPAGGEVRHAELSSVIGRDIRRHRHVMHSAFRVMEREHGVIFSALRGVGYRRLDTARVVETVGHDARRSIGRKARRTTRALVAATKGTNDLTPDQQRRLASEISTLGLIEYAARERVVKPRDNAPLKPTPVALTARRLILGDDGAAG